MNLWAWGICLNEQYKYPKGLRLRAVLDYSASNSSKTDICKKYRIRSRTMLQIWIKKRYNSHEELRYPGRIGTIIMIKGRKITLE